MDLLWMKEKARRSVL